MAPQNYRQVSSKSRLQDMVYNAYKYYLKEQEMFKESPSYSNHVKDVELKTAKATGVTLTFLRNIIKEKEHPDSKFNSIKYNSLEYYKTIRQIVHTKVFEEQGKFLLPELKANLALAGFQFNKKFLKNVLEKMGYGRLKIAEDKQLLVEKNRVRLNRIKYLNQIQDARSAGRNIVYVGDNFLCTFPKNNAEETQPNIILVHAFYNNAFLPGALMLNKSSDTTNMNSEKFYTWIQNQLIPSLPTNSVIILENEKLHNEMLNKPPNFFGKKEDMKTWLTEHEIEFDPDFYRVELYFLIKKNRTEKIRYKLDDILKEYGHTVLRLPKYHSDLNPINIIWGEIRDYLTTNYVKDMKIDEVETLITEKLNEITEDVWTKAVEEVIDIEDKYMKFEYQFDDFTDDLIDSKFVLKDATLSGTEFSDSDSDYSDSDFD